MNNIANKVVMVLMAWHLCSFTLPVASAEVTFVALPDTENSDDAFDPQHLFDEAMDSLNSGQIFRAIRLLETILSNKPGLNRARLELAVSYHQAHLFQKARQQFDTVLNDPSTPQTVKLAIIAYLAQLASDEKKPSSKHEYSIYVETGLLYDSNVNVGVDRSLIEVDGTLFSLSNSDKINSFGLNVLASIAHRFKLDKPIGIGDMASIFEWQSQAVTANQVYLNAKASDFTLSTLSVSSGPALVAQGHWRALVNLKLDNIIQGGENLALFSSINPVIYFDLGGFTGLTLEASLLNRDYKSSADTGRDNHGKILGTGFSKLIENSQVGLEGGIRFHSNMARQAFFSNEGLEVYAGGFLTTSIGAVIYTRISTRSFEYQAPDPTFSATRDDDEWRLSTGFDHHLTRAGNNGLILKIELSYTNNDSTIDAYDYNRSQFGVSLNHTF